KSLVTNREGKTDWTIEVEEWGRYMIRVCDEESGHCSGTFFYAGYPWYDNEDDDEEDPYAQQQMRQAASMLAFVSDKEKYNVGDEVKLNIPASEAGRCLVSIENGSRVVETYWIDAQKGDNQFSFFAQPEMTPTVYAHVTMIQPHGQVQNDLPIRMYGVVPIHVEDATTRLHPELAMPSELKPEEKFTVKVSEKDGRPMAYTLAVVDDGLLDLTRFKTPQPWNTFYAREALGVKTWDVYDHVLGAYGGKMENVLSIGGDDAAAAKAGGEKANRFKPVVVHLGPFYLKKGATASHEITMPNYVGSVRTMVVASKDGAYGNAEKTTPVRKPLMMLATLPRVLGPGETLKLPIDIFAMDKKVKNVKVKVQETSGLVEMLDGNAQTLSFSKIGDQMATFDIRVKESVGVAKFKMTATGAGETASQEIEIQVRNPNPYVTEVVEKIIQPGESWTPSYEAVGVAGTNTGTMEISNIPPIDLGRRLRYLIRYPHGCVEQTTSAAFPQLYVSRLLDVDENMKKWSESNIKAAIRRLKRFQTSEGGLSYWPGNRSASDWGTTYAGHFLIEAKNLGYTLPVNFIDRWVSYQKNMARRWTNYTENSSYGNYYNQAWHLRQRQLEQSYRLYVLALSGNAELGAMNQLREIKGMYHVARWRLAGAYALAGKPEVADQIIQGLATDVEDYKGMAYSYGSGTRDEAMILEVLSQLKKMDQAAGVAKRISERLNSERWMSTQTLAYSLLAVGKFVGDNGQGKQFDFEYRIADGKKTNAGSSKPMVQLDVPIDQTSNRTASIKNTSSSILYARLVLNGQPLVGDTKEEDNNLRMNIKYMDMQGESIDPAYLTQGTDFVAEITITNPGYRYYMEEMALHQIFPSGWEIHNSRLNNMNAFQNTTTPEYQDIRDDRVYTYFDIWKGNRNKHTYRVQLNAAYQGKYYLPTVYCEAMYDNNIYARQPGMWVEVGQPGGNNL
ncbi:MAG: alpha-2-macroglobulin family protein, partial [Bacteroidota bacterium]